jgi:hypothetical protein
MRRGRIATAGLLASFALVLAPIGTAHADEPAPSTPPASAPATPEPSPIVPTTEPTTPPTTPPVIPPPTTPPTVPPTKPPKPPRTKLPLREGDHGPLISKAQARLAWLGYSINPFSVEDQYFGKTTKAAVKKFQIKFWLTPTGTIDKTTWKKLSSIAEPVGVLPKHCTETTSICADKTAKIIRYVVKGKVKLTVDARFGLPGMETGEGIFRVHQRDYDHTSSLYNTWMPRALFFNGDQAVHFSPYFQRDGYNGGSHGCIGIRDMEKATWLFNQVPMGGRVYVYRS